MARTRRARRRPSFWWEVLFGITAVMLATRPDRWLRRLWAGIWRFVVDAIAEHHRAYSSHARRAEAHRAAAEGIEYLKQLKQRQREEDLFSGRYVLTAQQEVERILLEMERLRKRTEESN